MCHISKSIYLMILMLFLTSSVILADEEEKQKNNKYSLGLGVGYYKATLAENTGDEAILGPNNENYSGLSFMLLGANKPGFGLRAEFNGYVLTKGWKYLNVVHETKWEVSMYKVLGEYSVILSNPENPRKVYFSLLGGPTIGVVSVKDSKSDENSIIPSGFNKPKNIELGFTVGCNLEVQILNNKLGIVFEPSYTTLTSSVDISTFSGNYNLGQITYAFYCLYYFDGKK